MTSFDKYAATKKRKQRILNKVLAFVGIVSFSGTAIYGTISAFSAGLRQEKPTQVSMAQQETEQLQAERKGYELVLQREPDNQNALENLAKVQIQLQDLKGAEANLEKLVKLDPNRAEYQLVLQEVRKRMGDR